MWCILFAVAHAAWPEGSQPALDGPLASLAFGMDAERVWAALPATLRPAFDVSLSVPAFDALVAAHPEILDGKYPGSGGNRWSEHKSVGTAWPELDGAQWRVEVRDGGLTRVLLHYPSEAAALGAMKRWGAPAHDARWKVWLGSVEPEGTGVRAAYTGCFSPSDGVSECTVELMPYQRLETVVADVLAPRIGVERSSLPEGSPTDTRAARLSRPPYEISSGFVPLEIKWSEAGAVIATRTQLDYTYDTSQRARIQTALAKGLGKADGREGSCEVWTSPPARVCETGSAFVVMLGDATAW